MRLFETHTALGQAIDVWRLHQWVTVASNVAIQIITDDQQHIRSFGYHKR